jgi:CRP-like cAMP-binding protein
LEKVELQAGEMLISAYQNADSIVIIQKGIVEVYTMFEGNEFVIERLTTGAIINSRNFFMEDLIYVNMRCQTQVTFQQFTRDKFQYICDEHDRFMEHTQKYTMKVMQRNRQFYLDYIVSKPTIDQLELPQG